MCALISLLVLATQSASQEPAAPEPQPIEEPTWEFSGSVFYSSPPDSPDRFTPIFYADRGQLHLEARYNYEDLHTGSVFFGWNFSGGEELTTSVTPMIGAVAGDTRGIAPGLELDVGYKKVNWYAEAEYLFDLDSDQDDFFYCWSTLTYAFTDSLNAGLVTERSRLVEDGLSLQRGLALQVHQKNVGLGFYLYNIDSSDCYLVVSFDVKP
jgi:hypothetical protein